MRRLVVAPLIVLVSFAAAIGMRFSAAAFEDPYQRLISVSELRQRDVVYFERLDAFAVWREGRPLVLKVRHPIDGHWHFPNVLLYCRSSRQFEAHDSMFDRSGRYRSGPALRGLDRFPTRLSDGWLWVDRDELVVGPARPLEPDPWILRGRFCGVWFEAYELVHPGIAIPAR